MGEDRIREMEQEIVKIRKEMEEKEDEEEREKREREYRLTLLDRSLVVQNVHGNLTGLGADDHVHYLNQTRHDTMNRHTFVTPEAIDALEKLSGNSLPVADESYRGQFFTKTGGEGTADKVYVCIKNEEDNYEWEEVSLI